MKTATALRAAALMVVVGALRLAAAGHIFGAAQLPPATGLWTDVNENTLAAASQGLRPAGARHRTVALDSSRLNAVLDRAPHESRREARSIAAADSDVVLDLPWPDGGTRRFRIEESSVMAPELAAKFPELRTYRGQGVDDPKASVRFDWTPSGFHAMVLSTDGTVYVDPHAPGDVTHYRSYFHRDAQRLDNPFSCAVNAPGSLSSSSARSVGLQQVPNGTLLRTYRLAVAATGEYTAVFGGTVAGAMNGIVTTINRVDGIYESELAIRLTLVANNDAIVYTDATTDPYSNITGPAMQAANQANLDAIIGTNNYDIGHVFGTSGGGRAAIGSVCQVSSKAQGVTGITTPIGDSFDVDYVAHEMGHQFGANHTFNSVSGTCAGARVAANAYEPASGTTIMAYAGLCDSPQPHSDAYFHAASLTEITNFISDETAGGSCGVATPTGNTPPTVDAGPEYWIPKNTPFALTATGNDVDGDSLTYAWEEFDLGTASPPTDLVTQPLFRSLPPSTSATRVFPQLSILVANSGSPWERLSVFSRDLKFRVTARDNRTGGGGTASADTTVHVAAGSSGFSVFSSYPGGVLVGSSQFVSWDVANTAVAPINTTNVRITLSSDNGLTFPTVLAANAPNTGNFTFTVPNVPTTTARVKVEAVGNIYFAWSFTFKILASNVLSVSKAGTGIGTVSTTTSVTINCGPTCAGIFQAGQAVSLTATPLPGSTFMGWTGDADCADGVVTMATGHACIATFISPPAAYDPILKVPVCGTPTGVCDSGTLLSGRDSLSGLPESHQPNTLFGSCPDGTIEATERIDRIFVSTADHGPFLPGKTVNVDVSVVAGDLTNDALDLYYTATAGSPSWTYIATVPIHLLGFAQQDLLATYVLPAGGLQAVRARFRRGGSPSTCTVGDSLDDHDDLAFVVGAVQNGTFTGGASGWQQFATPDSSYMVSNVSGGVFQFYRQPAPAGTTNQAVIYQETGLAFPAGSPVNSTFALGNSSSTRKRISVLMLDHDFSDLSVCTFWLPPGAPLKTYGMNTHALHPWVNAAIYFYAATPGSDGGFNQISNVSMQSAPSGSAVRTECIDPTAPAPVGGNASANLLTNGDFSNGVSSWNLFGQITQQVTNGVFEFIRTADTPAGVVFQPTGATTAANEVLTATLDLGNSSAVRKRVTVLLHDLDFTDLTACTFWLEPSTPLQTYAMRGFSTKAWANATISIYPATTGVDQWIQLDNVALQRTPGLTITGTQCLEPGDAGAVAVAESGGLAARPAASSSFGIAPTPAPTTSLPLPATSIDAGALDWVTADGFTLSLDVPPDATGASWQAVASATGRQTLTWARSLDLGAIANAGFHFESWLSPGASTGEVQVSLDGLTWQTVARVPASNDWTSVDVDLSEFAGRVIQLRFVYDAVEPAEDSPPNFWLVGGIRVDARQPSGRQ